jgi:putative glycosyltransferase (TIGR04372 family)
LIRKHKVTLLAYIKAFKEKNNGKNFSVIYYELCIRGLSLLLFPLLFLLLMGVSLIKTVKLGFLYRERLGHLALNTDLYLRRRFLGIIPKNELHIFFVYRPANMQLVEMFSRKMIIVNSELLFKLASPIGLLRTRFWQSLPFFGNEYAVFQSAPPQIEFSDSEEQKGKSILRQLGLGESDWYVCIFARDHQYYRIHSPNTDASFSNHRNADINTYELAIHSILGAGGWVIRMGSCVEKPLNFKHPRVIDYALDYRDDFSDVYITAHATFYVGSTSGASDLAAIFDVPYVGVNIVPAGYAPFGKHSIYIPKKIISSVTGERITFDKQLNAFTGNQVGVNVEPEKILALKQWCFADNTPEEINDVVQEMMQRLNNNFDFDDEYLKLLDFHLSLYPSYNIYRENKSPVGKKMLMSLHL